MLLACWARAGRDELSRRGLSSSCWPRLSCSLRGVGLWSETLQSHTRQPEACCADRTGEARGEEGKWRGDPSKGKTRRSVDYNGAVIICSQLPTRCHFSSESETLFASFRQVEISFHVPLHLLQSQFEVPPASLALGRRVGMCRRGSRSGSLPDHGCVVLRLRHVDIRLMKRARRGQDGQLRGGDFHFGARGAVREAECWKGQASPLPQAPLLEKTAHAFFGWSLDIEQSSTGEGSRRQQKTGVRICAKPTSTP